MPILIPCQTCSSTRTVTCEDRHAETRQDVCPTCAPYADVHPGMVPARTGETREASFDPAALPPLPCIEFHQQDFVPGFAAFLPGATTPAPDSRAFCIINLGSLLAMIQAGDMACEELPYLLAESMMHEVIHVLEQWAGVEFNEERVEALLEKYRATYGGQEDAA